MIVSKYWNGTANKLETRVSSVTSSWGVDWDEDQIARDIMQNFYDANKEQIEQIKTTVEGRDVIISAPDTFDLERLFFLGSEKGDEDVGQYGEGFKAAAMCLLRDHQVSPVAISGRQLVKLSIREESVGLTAMKPLVYDFYELITPVAETRLILCGCSQKLISALTSGLSHFFFEKNQLIGRKIWSSWDDNFSIYESSDTQGYVFYRNLRRGDIKGISLILVINKPYQRIEKKIIKDRDRLVFCEILMADIYAIFSQNGIKSDQKVQRLILEYSRNVWVSGHPLLSTIAKQMAWRSFSSFSDATALEIFGNKYFARSKSNDPHRQFDISRLEEDWQKQGRIGLPGYFESFGVISGDKQIRENERKALEEEKKQVRPPTPGEFKGISVLSEIMKAFAPEIVRIFKSSCVSYTVGNTEKVWGELRRGRGYRSVQVYLAEKMFVADFSEALAVFLHEHSHIFGFDGSRAFTDALTQMLQSLVLYRKHLDKYEKKWNEVRKEIFRERADCESCSYWDELESMSKETLP